jgi:hypothetical protein
MKPLSRDQGKASHPHVAGKAPALLPHQAHDPCRKTIHRGTRAAVAAHASGAATKADKSTSSSSMRGLRVHALVASMSHCESTTYATGATHEEDFVTAI